MHRHDEGVEGAVGRRRIAVPYDDIHDIVLKNGWLSARIEVRFKGGVLAARGLERQEAEAFYNAVRQEWLAHRSRLLQQWVDRNSDALKAVGASGNPLRYLRHSESLQHHASLRELIDELPDVIPSELSDHPATRTSQAARRFCDDPEGERSLFNSAYVDLELKRSEALLDSIESRPLTEEQRRAVVTDEDHNLVIASAGSGKTSVLVAKIAHLISQGRVEPEEILVLAFNRAACDELAERFALRIKDIDPSRIRVNTFHSLGLDIVAKATSRRPEVAAHAASTAAASRHLETIIDDAKSIRGFPRILVDWFAYYLKPYKSPFDFKSKGDYYSHLEAEEIVTRNGETVRSHEECMIADFLRLRGVSYIYEHPYEIDTATAERRQYRPDFFLKDYGIYLEHFGIDRNGNTAPYIDSQAYAASMNWKRRLHAEHGTTMIETYSYERFEGNLLPLLEKKLQKHGIEMSEDSADVQLEALGTKTEFSRLSKLLSTFMSHYRSNDLDENTARKSVAAQPDKARARAFLDIFLPVLDLYQRGLDEAGEIDFEGMIQDAARHVESGTWTSPYRYILVDEFQDISTSRARLVRAMCKQDRRNQLFAVGDDWQSIYRFAGSNVRVMTEFDTFFGVTAQSALSTTFRCNQKIVEASSRFVAKNPEQISKDVKAFFERDQQALFVVWNESSGPESLPDCLDRISLEVESASVLVLARYRHLLDVDRRRVSRLYPGLDISYRSVHSAKGLEADYVVVLGMNSGKYGFPSEVDDDPLLLLAQGQEDSYEHAEERRLFYVALTRARQAVYLSASLTAPSGFVREVVEDGYLVDVIGKPLESVPHCPECETGLLQERTGKRGAFFSCSHYPRCQYTENACPACGKGRVIRGDGQAHCEACGAQHIICPSCQAGYLQRRKGRYGPFMGCSDFPNCRYTAKIDA